MATQARRRARVALLLVVASVAGCGYKGPLYIPAAKAPAAKPVTVITPPPAPDRPVPAEAIPAPK